MIDTMPRTDDGTRIVGFCERCGHYTQRHVESRCTFHDRCTCSGLVHGGRAWHIDAETRIAADVTAERRGS